MRGQRKQIWQSTTAEVRLDESNVASSGSARPTRAPFGLLPSRPRANFVAASLPGTEDQVHQTGNPENVGLHGARKTPYTRSALQFRRTRSVRAVGRESPEKGPAWPKLEKTAGNF